MHLIHTWHLKNASQVNDATCDDVCGVSYAFNKHKHLHSAPQQACTHTACSNSISNWNFSLILAQSIVNSTCFENLAPTFTNNLTHPTQLHTNPINKHIHNDLRPKTHKTQIMFKSEIKQDILPYSTPQNRVLAPYQQDNNLAYSNNTHRGPSAS